MAAEQGKQRAGQQQHRDGGEEFPHRPHPPRRVLVKPQPVADEAPRAVIGIGAARLHDGAWQTSTHCAPTSSAIRIGAIRTALWVEPAAGTTSSWDFSETSQ